ncbi:MAG: hypothetical protein ACE5GW_09650, partial [Planctomycetota bacterium]
LGCPGDSAVEGSAALHEQIYDDRRASPDDSFPRPTGAATRYGEVTALVQFHDDLLVVLVPGDRVVVDFPAPAAPAEGASRTYFLRVTGWAKEASYHNRTGGTIEPLPFRAMSRYPPPPGEGREDETYRAWLHAYQSRIIRR